VWWFIGIAVLLVVGCFVTRRMRRQRAPEFDEATQTNMDYTRIQLDVQRQSDRFDGGGGFG
jgi:uncharacterized membrane-anchored protein YhcB (DUF1043 family)